MPNFKVVVKAAYEERVREIYHVTAKDRDEATLNYSEEFLETIEELKDEGGDLLWSDIESVTETEDEP